MASWTERAAENGPHMPSASVWCEGYEILISLPNSFLLVRVVWEEGPENRWNHCNLLLAPLLSFPLLSSFLTLSIDASHPALNSSTPLLLHPFHPFFFPSSILFCSFSTRLLHYTSRGHPLARNMFFLLPLCLFLSSPCPPRDGLSQCYFRLYSC